MFRFMIALLAAFALGSLIFGGAGTAVAGFGLLLVPLFFVFKLFLFFALFGMISRAFWRRGWTSEGSPRWDSWHERHHDHRWDRYSSDRHRSRRSDRRPTETPSEKDRFEEWHRMAHAREEVDSWTPDEI